MEGKTAAKSDYLGERAIVLGAGISRLSAARVLAEQLNLTNCL